MPKKLKAQVMQGSPIQIEIEGFGVFDILCGHCQKDLFLLSDDHLVLCCADEECRAITGKKIVVGALSEKGGIQWKV